MKRTDITALFPDATDEQIKALMSINGSDINNARKGIEDLQAALDSAKADLESARNNSEELQAAQAKVTALQAEIDQRNAADTLRAIREKVAEDVGIPVHLLTGSTEEECKTQAQGILDFAKPQTYPNVRDGGEPGGTMKPTTRQQFAEWFDQIN